jgi:hypothetical protein
MPLVSDTTALRYLVELRIRDALRKAAAQKPPPETQET